MRLKGYSLNTEESYISWIIGYIRFNRFRNPSEMGEKEIESYLTHIVVHKKYSASSQSQAFAAVLYLYKEVLGHCCLINDH